MLLLLSLLASILTLQMFASVAFAADCKIVFTLQPKNESVALQSPLGYALTIKNIGTTVCQNTSLSMYYNGETYVSAVPAASAAGYYWRVGDLAPQQSYDISLTTRHGATGPGFVKSEGCATAYNGNDSCAEATVAIGESSESSKPLPEQAIPPTPSLPATGTAPTATEPEPLQSLPSVQIPTHAVERGTWIWKPVTAMTETDIDALIRNAKQYGFNAFYLTLDYGNNYHDILLMPDGPVKEQKKKQFTDALDRFIAKAWENGIVVDGEFGWYDWAEPENRHLVARMTQAAIEYNKTHSHTLRSIQFDIEPYVLSGYEDDKESYLRHLVETVDQTAVALRGTDLGLTLTIPHFYDERQNWTPSYSYNGVAAHTFTHLARILQRLERGTFIIMAYRNFAYGRNGAIPISEAEILETEKMKNIKIIVSAEAGNVPPAFVTFYGKSKQEALDHLQAIDTHFSGSPSYGGSAIHYIDPFLRLY